MTSLNQNFSSLFVKNGIGKSRLLFGLLLLSVLVIEPLAQCPDLSPPPCKAPTPGPPASCSIVVTVTRQGGDPLPSVTLSLNQSPNGKFITNAAGSYSFRGLPCKRSHSIAPSHPDYTFTPAIAKLGARNKSETVTFLAVPRKAPPTPTPKPNPCTSPPPARVELKRDEAKKDRLGHFCLGSTGLSHYTEYQLKSEMAGEILHFDLQSPQNADLEIQVFDSRKRAIPVETRVPPNRGPVRLAAFPEEGMYLIRVLSKSNKPAEYGLSVARVGLTDQGFNSQMQRFRQALEQTAPANLYESVHQQLEQLAKSSPAALSKLNAGLQILEPLKNITPTRPEVQTLLSLLYLYVRQDYKAALYAANNAIARGGEARFRVVFGKKIDTRQKRILYNIHTCWLVIKKREAYCESFFQNEAPRIFSTEPDSLNKIHTDVYGIGFALKIYGRGVKEQEPRDKGKPVEYEKDNFNLMPLTSPNPVTETAIIKILIRQHLQNAS